MPRLRFAFDDAAVIADDLGDQREPQAGAGRLVGDEGVKKVGADLVGHPAAVIPHRDHQGQVDLGLLPGDGQSVTVLGGVQIKHAN